MCMCLSICVAYSLGTSEGQVSIRAPEIVFKEDCEQPQVGKEMNLDPLQQQPVLLNPELVSSP